MLSEINEFSILVRAFSMRCDFRFKLMQQAAVIDQIRRFEGDEPPAGQGFAGEMEAVSSPQRVYDPQHKQSRVFAGLPDN